MSSQGAPKTFVVDDDRAVRESVSALLRAEGYTVENYDSGRAFLDAWHPDRTGCVLLDLMMPDMDGLAVQEALRKRGGNAATIFLTGHGDVAMAVQAMKAGAIDFLEKPIDPDALLDSLQRCMQHSASAAEETDLHRRLDRLTAREREVLDAVVSGLPNKVIGHNLGIVTRTVEVHRARVMEKMEARNLSELVRVAIALGIV